MTRILWSLFLVFLPGSSFAQECASPVATIVDYGIYERQSSGKVEGQPGVAAGYNTMVTGKTLKQETTVIPGKLGLSFGFRYSLMCSGVSLRTVPITIRVLHPAMENPTTGKKLTVSSWRDGAWTDTVNINSGFNFDEPWEIVPGKWTFQVVYGEQVLTQKEFEVVK